MLVEFMEDMGFNVMNGRTNSDSPAQFTYIGGRGCSVIDLIWVNNIALNKIEDLRVYASPVHSDHFPVILSLKNVEKKVDVAKKPFVKWRNQYECNYIEVMS